jgi:hypothetical protein
MRKYFVLRGSIKIFNPKYGPLIMNMTKVVFFLYSVHKLDIKSLDMPFYAYLVSYVIAFEMYSIHVTIFINTPIFQAFTGSKRVRQIIWIIEGSAIYFTSQEGPRNIFTLWRKTNTPLPILNYHSLDHIYFFSFGRVRNFAQIF